MELILRENIVIKLEKSHFSELFKTGISVSFGISLIFYRIAVFWKVHFIETSKENICALWVSFSLCRDDIFFHLRFCISSIELIARFSINFDS